MHGESQTVGISIWIDQKCAKKALWSAQNVFGYFLKTMCVCPPDNVWPSTKAQSLKFRTKSLCFKPAGSRSIGLFAQQVEFLTKIWWKRVLCANSNVKHRMYRQSFQRFSDLSGNQKRIRPGSLCQMAISVHISPLLLRLLLCLVPARCARAFPMTTSTKQTLKIWQSTNFGRLRNILIHTRRVNKNSGESRTFRSSGPICHWLESL